MLHSCVQQPDIANLTANMDTELPAFDALLTKIRAIKQGMKQELRTGKTRLK